MENLTRCTASLAFVLLGLLLAANASSSSSPPTTTRDWLSDDSVVLVCGAASYLGVELSLALHRTYKPKKLILVDELEDLHLSRDGFSQFELQRQRLFRALQQVSTSKDGEGDIVFYRADLRPEVPEFVDSSTIPVLQYIVKQHPDISHVVYLPEKLSLDETGSDANPKAIMMHAILDQLYQWKNTTGSSKLPQFTYASSSLVYSGDGAASGSIDTIYEGREDRPILEGPDSLEGIAHLLNEILAQSYYNDHQIDSIGLRFFQVYGPFESMPSLTAQIAGHAVSSLIDSSRFLTIPSEAAQPRHDYVFIDDAVDAIMLAMQVRPPPNFGPLAVNVGSGKSTDASELIRIAQSMNPDSKYQTPKTSFKRPNKVDIVASTDRAKKMLGWEPQVSLEEGMQKTLGWHFDRIFPEGAKRQSDKGGASSAAWERISASGRLGCNGNDLECLRGMDVLPCASECALDDQCYESFWDAPAAQSRKASSHCSEVWYTVSLDAALVALPAVSFRVSTQSRSHLPNKCNFAFVSEESPLVEHLRSDNAHRGGGVLDYGEFWTVVPVPHTTYGRTASSLEMLPKLSPGQFFAETVELALYTEPKVIVDDLPLLLSHARMKPYNAKVQTRTGMLVGKARPGKNNHKRSLSSTSANKHRTHQASAYRNYNIKMLGQVNGTKDELGHQLDSSFVVHVLGEKLPQAFRCEVLKEVTGWRVDSFEEALSFVSGIHDKFSQMLVLMNRFKNEGSPWWHGDEVETILEDSREGRRRLEESENGIRRVAPMQHHHLLQHHIVDGREVHEVEVHHFDENGFAVRKEKLGFGLNQGKSPPEDSPQTNNDDEESEDGSSDTDTDPEEENIPDQIWLSMLAESTTRFFVRMIPANVAGITEVS